ncbi:MAG: metal ABC transporter solute-binding protein, Zn/Mn family [Planctomycetaceae bacterium]
MSCLPGKGRVLLLLGMFAAALSGCGPSPTAETTSPAKSSGGKFRIVTTCGMVTDIVRVVAGEKGDVVGLMAETVDPHLYKPLREDVKALNDADVVFYSGLMLEGRMGDLFASIGRKGKPVFAVTEGIDESYLREPPEFAGHYDPHVWMDVAAWSRCVEFVAKSLGEFDKPNASYYEQNAAAYRTRLKDLDDYIRKVIGTIPKEQRYLVTAHDAFGYFSRAYDIPVKSVQGISTESEAGVDDINKLVEFLVQNKVKAIFVESSVSPRNLEAVIEGTGRKGAAVKIGGELYSDAMGPSGSYEGTYIGMMDHNATVIARALGGEAPEKGFDNKLTAAEKK